MCKDRMKKISAFTLSVENKEFVRLAAKRDDRSMSQWLDILLSKHFKKYPQK